MRLVAILILAATLATPAAAFRAQNGLIVKVEGPEHFVVPFAGLGGPSDFWCAAGDYAYRKLGLPTKQLLYRASEPPRRSGEGIRFSTNPADAASSTGLLVLGAKGGGLTIGMARAFCETSGEFEFD